MYYDDVVWPSIGFSTAVEIYGNITDSLLVYVSINLHNTLAFTCLATYKMKQIFISYIHCYISFGIAEYPGSIY
jgi:hypothetical protein